MQEDRRVHLIIKGRVQGVGFRYFIYTTAINLHLKGWVRNRASGNVEILAQGAHKKINQLIQAARKGPDMAQVLDVDIEWDQKSPDLPPFTILNTK